jgi:uncharacterized membrane protein YeaQ/YmgE (transglycosylase-associated protein family)
VTGTSLITAVTVGLVVGVLVRWLVPACRSVPFWLPMAVGIGAAILGTVVARLAGVDDSQVSLIELVLQVALAGLGVGAVALTADRQAPSSRYAKRGKPQ